MPRIGHRVGRGRTLALTGPVNGPSIYSLLTSACCAVHTLHIPYTNDIQISITCIMYFVCRLFPNTTHKTEISKCAWPLGNCALGRIVTIIQNAKRKYCVRWNGECRSWRSASMPHTKCHCVYGVSMNNCHIQCDSLARSIRTQTNLL